MAHGTRTLTVIVGVGALLGLLFAGVSTYDFVMHLDRQVHDVHCSFIPGMDDDDPTESGCEVTLVSPYSSVLRTTVWGGIPISLPAMAVFAFLLAFAVDLLLTKRHSSPRASGWLLLATLIPGLTSVVMGYISLVELDAVCKLCIGVYVASAICVGAAAVAWRLAVAASHPGRDPIPRARVRSKPGAPLPDEPAWTSSGSSADPAADDDDDVEPEPAAVSSARPPGVALGYLGLAAAVGTLFVIVPLASYLGAAPDHERFIGTCGSLIEPAPEDLLVPIETRAGGVPTIEILDPLCPACLGFEERLEASGLSAEMDRQAMLFPLDDSCNWMVSRAVHPGACAISRAMLCAGDRAPAVLDWAFSHQTEIRRVATEDPDAASRMVKAAFPHLESCVDAPKTRARLGRSLRWAVANRLPVLTPQLYVGEVKLCEEDVDIGLDFALERMLRSQRAGTLKPPRAEQPEPATGEAAPGSGRDDPPAAPASATAKPDPAAPEQKRTGAGERAPPPETPAAEPSPAGEPKADSPSASEPSEPVDQPAAAPAPGGAASEPPADEAPAPAPTEGDAPATPPDGPKAEEKAPEVTP